MNNILEYKGYHAKIEFDAETFSVRGKIEGINDFVDFESNSLHNIESEFHSAVDDYLDFCQEVGKDPDKEYKGTFNIRIKPELHRSIAIWADKKGISLNSAVEKAIEKYLEDETQTKESLKNLVQILTETIKTPTIYKYKDSSNIERAQTPFFLPHIRYERHVKEVMN